MNGRPSCCAGRAFRYVRHMANETAELRYHDEDPGWRLTVTGHPANPLGGFAGEPLDPAPHYGVAEGILEMAGYTITETWEPAQGYAFARVTRPGPTIMSGGR